MEVHRRRDMYHERVWGLGVSISIETHEKASIIIYKLRWRVYCEGLELKKHCLPEFAVLS